MSNRHVLQVLKEEKRTLRRCGISIDHTSDVLAALKLSRLVMVTSFGGIIQYGS
jgi:hypothetical protein